VLWWLPLLAETGAEEDELVFERTAAIEMTNGNPSGLARHGNCLYMVMKESVTPRMPQSPAGRELSKRRKVRAL